MQKKDLQVLSDNVEKLKHSLGEKEDQTQVVAVTKFVGPQVMRQLLDLGLQNFGENRMQVFEKKLQDLADIKDQITWHYIGRVQRRQVRRIINDIDYLHSLDSLRLAQEIQKRADQPVKCFVQVNISGESQKTGFTPEELEAAIRDLAAYDKIQVVGLMTMAPYEAGEDELNEIFAQLHDLRNSIRDLNLPHAPCQELSMGMSRDYPIALDHGSTYIRVGSALYDGLSDDLFL